MGLAHYGVVVGVLKQLDPSEQGTWFHGVFNVTAAGRSYKCTVDFANQTLVRVQYLVLDDLGANDFHPVLALPDGYHELARTSTSGALDYVRRSGLAGSGRTWTEADGKDAVKVMVAAITPPGSKLFVFGEPFTTGLGMHNVHMNQGDPPLSPDGRNHQADDGIWQDGATLIRHADGTLHAFLSKFASQTLKTDDHGLPA